MFINGFIHQSEENAFYGHVRIVSDIRFTCGKIIGYMELSDSDEIVVVKKHPSGCLVGQIVKDC